jgi:hypothetical protein
MQEEAIRKAVALTERVGHVFVATANGEGVPHLAAAGELEIRPDGSVVVTEWFCPRTMDNLQGNRRVALVAWDSQSDSGYQLVGEVEAVNDLAMLDGYAGGEAPRAQPQVEWELVVRVDEALDFSQGPHSDEPDV